MEDVLMKELAILRKVNLALSYAPDVEAVAGAILDIVIDETVAENASLMMPSSDGKSLEIRAAKGIGDEISRYSEKSLGQTFPIGEGIAGLVAQTLEPIIIKDAMNEPMVQLRDMKVKIGSMMSLPLAYGRGELVGVLHLSHSKRGAFTREDLALMNMLLAPAALALRNVRLMRDVEDMNRTLKEELCMTDRALEEFGKHAIKVFNYMSIGVLTTDPGGFITTMNRKAVELLGLGTGDTIAGIIGPEVIKRFAIDMPEIVMDRPLGKRVLNLELSVLPVKPSLQVLVCVRDVTLERFKERDLMRVQDQYRDLIENAIDAMYILRDGRFMLINKKLQDLLGYEAEDLIDRHIRHFLVRESMRILATALRPSQEHVFIPNLEILAKRKDGQIITIEISIGRVMVGQDQCYVGVVRDITSKKELLALKTRFLHVASHEIRVPLTVIRGYARMLAKDAKACLNEGQQDCVQEIEKHCEKLLNFSNALLDFARINSGRLTLTRQKVDLVDLIRHVTQDMQIKADEKGVVIHIEAEDYRPQAYIDPLRIEQAFNNIIDNALKHSPEQGVVTVRLAMGSQGPEGIHKILNQEYAQISILDQGPGVKPEEAKDLFNEFFVGMSGKSKRGIGLGLAITKEIIHAHGGRIEAIPADTGGLFQITIPLNSHPD